MFTWLEGEVVHHLKPPHHHQIWFKVFKILSKFLHGGQIWVVVITVNNVSAHTHIFSQRHIYTHTLHVTHTVLLLRQQQFGFPTLTQAPPTSMVQSHNND